jgi:hypothetical protein
MKLLAEEITALITYWEKELPHQEHIANAHPRDKEDKANVMAIKKRIAQLEKALDKAE